MYKVGVKFMDYYSSSPGGSITWLEGFGHPPFANRFDDWLKENAPSGYKYYEEWTEGVPEDLSSRLRQYATIRISGVGFNSAEEAVLFKLTWC